MQEARSVGQGASTSTASGPVGSACAVAVKVGSSSCALLRRMASKARGTKRRGKEGSTRSSSAVVPNLVGAGSRSVRLTLTLILILTPTLTTLAYTPMHPKLSTPASQLAVQCFVTLTPTTDPV